MGIEAADGTKVAHQLTLRCGDYPSGPHMITGSLNMEEGGRRSNVKGDAI